MTDRYLTYSEMLESHINVLRDAGLDVTDLNTSGKWIRCNEISGKQHKKGQFVYKTYAKKLNKIPGVEQELYGLSTIYRGRDGIGHHRSFGLPPDQNSQVTSVNMSESKDQELANENVKASNSAYGFWQRCSTSGKSGYLEHKKVGSYGLRFRVTSEYGEVAVVPMVDPVGFQRGYQILRDDGVKVFAKGIKTEGLRHVLKPMDGSGVIAVCEGYATAATILELTMLPTICVFTAENLSKVVGSLIKSSFPGHLSPSIIIFADNDRHLEKNLGLTKALEAQKLNPDRIQVIVPDFGDIPPSRDASDWNDLMRLRGADHVKSCLESKLRLFATS